MPVTKDAIADAVERRIARFGYSKTTVDEIAADLGISKKTLYAHFEGKRDMYAYVVSRVAKVSRAGMAEAVAALPGGREKVIGLVRLVIAQGRAHVLETSEEDWRGEYEVAIDAFKEATGSLTQELVQSGIDSGEFAVRDALLARRMLAAMLVEYVLILREDPAFDRDEELVAAVGRYLG